MMSQIKKINFKKSDFMQQPPTLVSKLLPWLLILSFAFVGLYPGLTEVGADFNIFAEYNISVEIVISLNLLFIAAIQYLFYCVFLWIYKSILKSRPYFAFIGDRTFSDTFGLWYVAKNIVFGLILLLQFWAPYLANFFDIVNLVLSFLVVVFTYASLSNRVDVVFKPMIFKMMMWPWFVWQALGLVLSLLLGGDAL